MTEESRKMFEKIRAFLTVYMPKQRGMSNYTVRSYKQAINQYLDFVSETRKVHYEEMTFQNWDAATVNEFLAYLGEKRAVSAATRNQRLYAIRAFLKYARISEPELMALSMDISGIRSAKEPKEPVAFLNEEAMAVLLRQPDETSKIGLRDMCFMITLYDTAARDCEMLNLRLNSLDLNGSCPKVRLDGKGNKVRYVPLMRKTVCHLKKYIDVFHSSTTRDDAWLFYTVAHGRQNQMSDDNVARFLSKYSAMAHAKCNEVPERVTPHQFRHSRAMHLYRRGMSLQLLAEFMGHATVVSTQIYAYADTEMKRRAIERCQTDVEVTDVPDWQSDPGIIKKLYGLV